MQKGSQGNGAYYSWSPKALFRDTTGSEGKNVKGILQDAQTEVTLTAYSDEGCRNSDTVSIQAVACCDVLVPSAFSANGDGLNDYFKPQFPNGQRIVSFKIFDRWGKMVYDSPVGDTRGWDGNYKNGRSASVGMYNYFIFHTCDDQSHIIKRER